MDQLIFKDGFTQTSVKGEGANPILESVEHVLPIFTVFGREKMDISGDIFWFFVYIVVVKHGSYWTLMTNIVICQYGG